MENPYVMEMLNRQRIEEIHRLAERDRLVRQAGRRDQGQSPWRRVLAVLDGGRIGSDATGAREVPGL